MDTKTQLHEGQIQPTKARLAILDILGATQKPLDTLSVLERIQKKHIGIDRATVFRALKLLISKNMVHRVELSEGKSRYELSTLPHHHHLVCNQCGTIEDVRTCDIKSLEKNISKKTNFQINHHHLEFFGLCGKCH